MIKVIFTFLEVLTVFLAAIAMSTVTLLGLGVFDIVTWVRPPSIHHLIKI